MTWMCTVVRVLLVGRELGLVAVSHNYVSGDTHHLIKGEVSDLQYSNV
jgi:hypothetical protein